MVGTDPPDNPHPYHPNPAAPPHPSHPHLPQQPHSPHPQSQHPQHPPLTSSSPSASSNYSHSEMAHHLTQAELHSGKGSQVRPPLAHSLGAPQSMQQPNQVGQGRGVPLVPNTPLTAHSPLTSLRGDIQGGPVRGHPQHMAAGRDSDAGGSSGVWGGGEARVRGSEADEHGRFGGGGGGGEGGDHPGVFSGMDAVERENMEVIQCIQSVIYPKLRAAALQRLSNLRDSHPEMAPLMWYSYGVITGILQEVTSVYPYLWPPQLTQERNTNLCNALGMLQFIAGHPQTKQKFIEANMAHYLFPFLNTVSADQPYEYLRLTSLGVIGAMMKEDNAKVIQYLKRTEIMPLCVRIMGNSTLMGKTVATFIIMKFLMDEEGKVYMTESQERYTTLCKVFGVTVSDIVKNDEARQERAIKTKLELDAIENEVKNSEVPLSDEKMNALRDRRDALLAKCSELGDCQRQHCRLLRHTVKCLCCLSSHPFAQIHLPNTPYIGALKHSCLKRLFRNKDDLDLLDTLNSAIDVLTSRLHQQPHAPLPHVAQQSHVAQQAHLSQQQQAHLGQQQQAHLTQQQQSHLAQQANLAQQVAVQQAHLNAQRALQAARQHSQQQQPQMPHQMGAGLPGSDMNQQGRRSNSPTVRSPPSGQSGAGGGGMPQGGDLNAANQESIRGHLPPHRLNEVKGTLASIIDPSIGTLGEGGESKVGEVPLLSLRDGQLPTPEAHLAGGVIGGRSQKLRSEAAAFIPAGFLPSSAATQPSKLGDEGEGNNHHGQQPSSEVGTAPLSPPKQENNEGSSCSNAIDEKRGDGHGE
eukprot:GHVN01082567.1.p1 GENE.GHVN01082567.1~~GHVN01082567.1.p1  ORF type:complete len:805 (+),score=212.08 GHVN01082567.1:253-2667(+)